MTGGSPRGVSMNYLVKSDWEKFKDNVILQSQCEIQNFKGGRLSNFTPYWKTLTSDKMILNIVQDGLKIEFERLPVQDQIPKPYKFKAEKMQKIDEKMQQYLQKSIVEEAHFEEGQFVSNIFSEEKSDGDIRIILDLSKLNEFVVDRHFKMENIEVVKNLITPNCFMASLDWKDAYYSVKIHPKYRKYLRFYWRGKLYQFTCLPNGLKSAPRMFTKIAKIPISQSRKQGATVSTYIDDSFIKAQLLEQTRQSVKTVVKITDDAGFVTHPKKSELEPVQIKKHLGFIINSLDMTLKISNERVQKIKDLCDAIIEKVQQKQKVPLRLLAKAVGAMVSSLPANPYGRLDIRRVETCLNCKLNAVQRNYDKKVSFHNNSTYDVKCITDIKRWRDEIQFVKAPIVRPLPKVHLESDSSDQGWGGVKILDQAPFRITTNGQWLENEISYKNNYLELKGAVFTIFAFCKNMKDTHIQISSDNTAAVSYIKKQGGGKAHLNFLARCLWKWAKRNNNWISPIYLPGKSNTLADFKSRHINPNLEWKLSVEMFDIICHKFGRPQIDWFASRLNYKVEKFVSFQHDPLAWKIDAFSISWKQNFGYAFPPINQIAKCMQKAKMEKVKMILICPKWTTQPWYTEVLHNAYDYFEFDGREVSRSRGDQQDLLARKFLAVHLDFNNNTPLAHQRLVR